MPAESTRDKYNLPPRPFLYTLDQIMDLLRYEKVDDVAKSVHFDGRSPGTQPPKKMLARNIAAPDEKPEWRVEEAEFIRWLRTNRLIPMRRY